MTHRLDESITARRRSTCQRNGSTSFHFYLTIFQAVLLRVWNAEDISIEIADSNRNEERLMDCIEPLLNLPPLRFHTTKHQTFSEALRATRSEVLSTLAHGSVPFHTLFNSLHVPQSAEHSPLLQAFVDYRQAEGQRKASGKCEMTPLQFELGKAAYDISLDIVNKVNFCCTRVPCLPDLGFCKER